MEARKSKAKKYTCAELLAMSDSSDDEMYSGECKVASQFPWHSEKHESLYDKVSLQGVSEYQKAH